MAEFSEVMRQLNRLCSHYQNCGESGCPMFDECGNIGAHCSDLKHSYRIEKTVMAWAAEHPEPQYPTWGEWLQSIGIILDVRQHNEAESWILGIEAMKPSPPT